jgi:O-antigen/teichoic acid export membrane protein
MLSTRILQAVRVHFDWGQFQKMIVTVASFLLGTSVATSLLGFVFWWVAARSFPPQIVGIGATAISAMTLLANLSVLGAGTTLIRELPRRRSIAGSLIVTGLFTVGLAGIVLGVIGALCMQFISPGLSIISANIINVALFAVGVCLTTIASLADQVHTALLEGQMQFVRNVIFSVVKLLALIAASSWLSVRFSMNIFVCWVFGIIVSLILIAGVDVVRGRIKLAHLPRPELRLARGLAKTALGHHVLNLEMLIPSLAMPVIVTAVLTPTATAYFYTAQNITAFISYAPFALAVSLYAVGAASPSALGSKVRFTLTLAMLLGVVANLFLVVGAQPILALFGKTYADQAATTMRLLALTVFPLIIKDHYVAIRRIQGRVAGAAAVMFLGTISEIVLAAIGGQLLGLNGVAIGWMVALCVEAIFVAPELLQMLRQTEQVAVAIDGGISEQDTVVLPGMARMLAMMDQATIKMPALVQDNFTSDFDTVVLPGMARQLLEASFGRLPIVLPAETRETVPVTPDIADRTTHRYPPPASEE